jgi:tetratricopeptide (TPR) repeat protein
MKRGGSPRARYLENFSDIPKHWRHLTARLHSTRTILLHGAALQMLGKHREALAAYNRALSLNPHDERVQRVKNDLIKLLKQP